MLSADRMAFSSQTCVGFDVAKRALSGRADAKRGASGAGSGQFTARGIFELSRIGATGRCAEMVWHGA